MFQPRHRQVRGTPTVKPARKQLHILSAYRDLGSYRAAAAPYANITLANLPNVTTPNPIANRYRDGGRLPAPPAAGSPRRPAVRRIVAPRHADAPLRAVRGNP